MISKLCSDNPEYMFVMRKFSHFAEFYKFPMLKFQDQDMTTVLRSMAFAMGWACSTAYSSKSNKGMKTKLTVLEK